MFVLFKVIDVVIILSAFSLMRVNEQLVSCLQMGFDYWDFFHFNLIQIYLQKASWSIVSCSSSVCKLGYTLAFSCLTIFVYRK